MKYDVGHPRCRQQIQMHWLCHSVCPVEPIVQSGGLVSGWSLEAAFFFSPFAEQPFLGSVVRICSLMTFPILKDFFLTSSTLKMEVSTFLQGVAMSLPYCRHHIPVDCSFRRFCVPCRLLLDGLSGTKADVLVLHLAMQSLVLAVGFCGQLCCRLSEQSRHTYM